MDPDPGAVDVQPDERQQRQQEQYQAGRSRSVGESLQAAVVAQEQQDGDEQSDTHGHPDELLGGEGLGTRPMVSQVGDIDAVDHR
jgi:hypothetical protein